VRAVVCQPPDVALIEAALDAIADDCSRRGAWTYQLWFEICCALQCELGDDGFTLFDSWSSRSPTYKESDCIKKWHYCSEIKTFELGTIFHFANVADPHWRDNYLVKVARQAAAAFQARRGINV